MLPQGAVGRQNTFSFRIEGNPHGTVHGTIKGDMGSIRTSARDPIFWLHHANIDRLWTAWMKAKKRTLPDKASAWWSTTWTFDVAGNMKRTAGAMVDPDGLLDYRYDNETMPVLGPLVAQATTTTIIGNSSGNVVGVAPAAVPTAPLALSATSNMISLGLSLIHI